MDNYSVQYQIHRKYQGWENSYVYDGQIAGKEYSNSRIEGIKIRIVPRGNRMLGLEYKAFINKQGLQEWTKGGELAGTENQGIGLNSLKIQLTNAPAGVGIEYQGYVEGIGWQDLKKDGETVGLDQDGKNLYGIRIRLVNTKQYSVQYRVHRQYVGWKEDWVCDGELAGVSDTSSRIEGIQIRIVPKIYHSKFSLELPVKNNISGNSLKIKGWEISEDKNTQIKVYVDGNMIHMNYVL